MSEGHAVGFLRCWRQCHCTQLTGGFVQTPAIAMSAWWLLRGVTHQGLLIFGSSWVLTLSDHSQQVPFSFQAVSTFHECICNLQTSPSNTSIVKGAIIRWPRPRAPVTYYSFFFLLFLFNSSCFSFSLYIPFNDTSSRLLVCVTGAVCSLMKQQQLRWQVSHTD